MPNHLLPPFGPLPRWEQVFALFIHSRRNRRRTLAKGVNFVRQFDAVVFVDGEVDAHALLDALLLPLRILLGVHVLDFLKDGDKESARILVVR